MGTNDLPDWAQVIARPDTILAGSPMAYISGSSTATFAMPTGVHLFSIVLPGFANITNILVTGATTGVRYFEESPNESIYQAQYYVLIPAGADTSVTVTISAGAPGNAYLTGVSDTVAVAALPQNPAPWQAPNRPPLKVSFANPGQNNTVTIIPAQPNSQSIWLHSFMWQWSTTNGGLFGNWQDSTPVVIGSDTAAVTAGPRNADWKGAKLSAGTSFQFVQTGAAAASTGSCLGTITYSAF